MQQNKYLKIAVMVMAVNAQPSLRNVEAFTDSVIAYQNQKKESWKNEYDFFIYWSEANDFRTNEVIVKEGKFPNVHNLIVNEEEGIYRTFEKTIRAFDYVHHRRYQETYDLYVRVNISMFLNIDLLDAVADKLKPGCVYCNAINSYINANSKYVNDLYGRGDLLIFSKSVMDVILGQSEKYMYEDTDVRERCGIDHVDDCILGLCFIDGMGKDYYQKLYMLNYNYIPEYDVDENVKRRLLKYAIGSRVKTVPPEIGYSGYSWDDNEWRLRDGEKMKELTEYYSNAGYDYKDVKFDDVLVDKKNSRPTLFVQIGNVNVYDVFWKFLEQKR